MLIAIVILVVIVIGLFAYNITIHKKIKLLRNTNQKINSLNVLQDFMNIVGSDNTVDLKIEQINEKLIERFGIKYSTIVIFNGAEYQIKATNVAEQHWSAMKNLHTHQVFKDCIVRATPKYITVEKDSESLAYQTTEIGRAKSAMFFPLYIDNIYIGYWIIESGEKHAFDSLDLSIIEIVKENIIVVLKTVSYQTTMENIVRKDLFSGLNSAEYLYGEGKIKIDKYTSSTICMLKISNLEKINEEYNRKTGNNLIIEVSNVIKSELSSEYIFVRYMGPKFLIAFIGEEKEEVTQFISRLKKQIETTEVKVVQEKVRKNQKNEEEIIYPKVNFIISTYYKGTGLDNINKKLEEYLDNASSEENDINFI